jgi:hypothetical protein
MEPRIANATILGASRITTLAVYRVFAIIDLDVALGSIRDLHLADVGCRLWDGLQGHEQRRR